MRCCLCPNTFICIPNTACMLPYKILSYLHYNACILNTIVFTPPATILLKLGTRRVLFETKSTLKWSLFRVHTLAGHSTISLNCFTPRKYLHAKETISKVVSCVRKELFVQQSVHKCSLVIQKVCYLLQRSIGQSEVVQQCSQLLDCVPHIVLGDGDGLGCVLDLNSFVSYLRQCKIRKCGQIRDMQKTYISNKKKPKGPVYTYSPFLVHQVARCGTGRGEEGSQNKQCGVGNELIWWQLMSRLRRTFANFVLLSRFKVGISIS